MLLDDIEKQEFELHLKADRNATDEALLLCFQQGRNKMLKHYAKSNWLYCASLVLDPRHKAHSFDLTSWGQEMKCASINTFRNIFQTYCRVEDTQTIEHVVDVDDFYGKLSKYYQPSQNDPRDEEFESYKNTPRVGKDTDILLWWKPRRYLSTHFKNGQRHLKHYGHLNTV